MTFSRLTLGEPRLKSKLRGGSVDIAVPCEQEIVTDTDLLNGRGDCETYVSATGRTELAETINTAARGDISWPDGTVVEPFESGGRKTLLPFYHTKGTTLATVGDWHVSTASPDTGTYHLRLTGHADNPFGSNSLRLLFAAGMVCPDIYSFDDWHADRYPEGAVITFQFRGKVSIPDDARVFWGINNIVNGEVLTNGFQRITASYTTYSISGIVDLNTFPNTKHVYPSIFVDFDANTTTDVHIDIDNVVYGIEL